MMWQLAVILVFLLIVYSTLTQQTELTRFSEKDGEVNRRLGGGGGSGVVIRREDNDAEFI